MLRGTLHLRLSSLALAKECLMQALILDVKNYEAFRELVEGGMMSSTEGGSSLPACPIRYIQLSIQSSMLISGRMGLFQQSRIPVSTFRGTVKLCQADVSYKAEEGESSLSRQGIASKANKDRMSTFERSLRLGKSWSVDMPSAKTLTFWSD